MARKKNPCRAFFLGGATGDKFSNSGVPPVASGLITNFLHILLCIFRWKKPCSFFLFIEGIKEIFMFFLITFEWFLLISFDATIWFVLILSFYVLVYLIGENFVGEYFRRVKFSSGKIFVTWLIFSNTFS